MPPAGNPMRAAWSARSSAWFPSHGLTTAPVMLWRLGPPPGAVGGCALEGSRRRPSREASQEPCRLRLRAGCMVTTMLSGSPPPAG